MLRCFLIFLMLGLVYFPFGKDKTVLGTVCCVLSDRQGSMLWLCIFLWSKCQLNTILTVILTHLAWWENLDIVEVEQLILFRCLWNRQEKICLCRFSEFNLLCICQRQACVFELKAHSNFHQWESHGDLLKMKWYIVLF